MAMHTVVQNDENDYDIEVGIVFGSDNLFERDKKNEAICR